MNHTLLPERLFTKFRGVSRWSCPPPTDKKKHHSSVLVENTQPCAAMSLLYTQSYASSTVPVNLHLLVICTVSAYLPQYMLTVFRDYSVIMWKSVESVQHPPTSMSLHLAIFCSFSCILYKKSRPLFLQCYYPCSQVGHPIFECRPRAAHEHQRRRYIKAVSQCCNVDRVETSSHYYLCRVPDILKSKIYVFNGRLTRSIVNSGKASSKTDSS